MRDNGLWGRREVESKCVVTVGKKGTECAGARRFMQLERCECLRRG